MLLEHPQWFFQSYPILSSQKATLSIIPYHFTTPPTSQNSIFFPFYLNILFLIFFFYYFFFSLPLPLFLPQPLAPALISSKPIPSKITASKSQQKITKIKQAPEIHMPT